MNERIKNQLLVVVSVVAVGCFLMALTANKSASQAKQELDQERYKRFNAEQNLTDANKRVNALESEIASLRDRVQSVQTILDEGKTQANDLKAQLETMNKTKELLEKKIEDLKASSNLPAPAPAQTPTQAGNPNP